MTRKWSRSSDKCLNCATTRHRHRARGYCTRCSYLVDRLKIVESWNADDPESLAAFPFGGADRRVVQKAKAGFAKQLNARLAFLRACEKLRTSYVSGLAIEYQLRRLSELAGNRRGWDLHAGLATPIGHEFSPEQRRFLFGLLNDIEEGVPWRIDLSRVLWDPDAKTKD